MARIYAVVEGQSEEAFIKNVLSPALSQAGAHLTPILLKHTGGDPRWARARGDITKLLKQDHAAFVTTMFDLYRIGNDWPGRPPSPITNGIAAAQAIEVACVQLLTTELDDSLRVARRFLPHIQPFEFEALLFSSPDSLSGSLPGHGLAPRLQAIRGQFPTPEDINDSPQTAPSKRIEQLFPGYKKVLYASEAAKAVGLTTMREECKHFAAWLARLEALAQATQST